MADTYIDLVNKLRRRFNEPDLDGTTWGTAVGWDRFCKDAINYAYHDILNAEMEWPFLHQSTANQSTIVTIPGVQLYNFALTLPAGYTSPIEIKSFDWDTFYINSNETTTAVTSESRVISSTFPYSATVTNSTTWRQDAGVTNNAGSITFTPTARDPATSTQYTVRAGTYFFNAANAGQTVKISYSYSTASTQINPMVGKHLTYMDYDDWHELLLSRDITAFQTGEGTPDYVFRSQVQGELGLSPVPDKVYKINFEYWIDPLDMVATTDTPLLPQHFYQVIIEGATKYCHQFREDMQMSSMAEKRFMQGISRMRTELINRQSDMSTGFFWYPHGRSYTLVTGR